MKLFSTFLVGGAIVGADHITPTKFKPDKVPLGFKESDNIFDFPETNTEKAGEWSVAGRCGGATIDQRSDKKCPNVLLINTDDMAWGDLSLNNPSKLIPTPNLDNFITKGINFRDGHSCTARCAPSRYCLHTGRYHFRRGDYHYKPIALEYGRKILTHLFKRNGYRTMVVGKPQPVEEGMKSHTDDATGDFYFEEGTRFWAYDRSFTSRSYCCRPGGGYFVNDKAKVDFNKWGIFGNFRAEDTGTSLAVTITQDEEDEFLKKIENSYLLDGWKTNGYTGDLVRNSYIAYWNHIDNNINSAANQDAFDQKNGRRRRDAEGKLLKRRRRGQRTFAEGQRYINEMINHGSNKRREKQILRYQDEHTGNVIVADFSVQGSTQDRSNYEFGGFDVNGDIDPSNLYDTKLEAELARQKLVKNMEKKYKNSEVPATWLNDLKKSRPKRTQVGFDSREIMWTFHQTGRDYITEHVQQYNPIMEPGEERPADKNIPFYLYLSFRAPHRPYSHNAEKTMPYPVIGKPGEQIGLFDSYIGNVMKTLHELKVADNTLILFTSDNGPDQGSFNIANKYGHLRMGTMRGKKASVYEGGHRVPFLSWWPLGIDKELHGSNYDLPVSQTDFFATFAEIMGYPLPGPETCTYGYDSNSPNIDDEQFNRLKRPMPAEDVPVHLKTYKAAITAFTKLQAAKEDQRLWELAEAANDEIGMANHMCRLSVNKYANPKEYGCHETCEMCSRRRKIQFEMGQELEGTPEDIFDGSFVNSKGNLMKKLNQKYSSYWESDAKTRCETHCYSDDMVYTINGKVAKSSAVQIRKNSYRVQHPSHCSTGTPCWSVESNYIEEVLNYGFKEVESWLSTEDKTGHTIGWEGCMAEDSHSFAGAFNKKINEEKSSGNTKVYDFKLDRGPSKIFAGKLGDLSIRLGRYKLIRFNAPKEWRTGPTRQHLNTFTHHEGAQWMEADPDKRCWYDEETGDLKNEGCSVEPMCRNTTTFGATTCMRDHYYQLFDLEKNFGEKDFCAKSELAADNLNANMNLEEILLGGKLPRFDMGAAGTKDPEKPSDPFGYGLGVESSKQGYWLNDCCVLNLDEKPVLEATAPKVNKDPCANKKTRWTKADGTIVEENGGKCKFWPGVAAKKFKGQKIDNFATATKWFAAHKKWYLSAQKFNPDNVFEWTEDDFDFPAVRDEWAQGFLCTNVQVASMKNPGDQKKTTAEILVDGEWRHSNLADRHCVPAEEDDEVEEETGPQFKLGCKVKDHQGPLAEGWEINHQWHTDATRWNADKGDSEAKNGEMRPRDFGKWAPFANCMMAAMKLMEGTAYAPELREFQWSNGRYYKRYADWSGPAWKDVKTVDGTNVDNEPMAGKTPGSGWFFRQSANKLYKYIVPGKELPSTYHGGGSRYNEDDDGLNSLVMKCGKHLPGDEPKPFVMEGLNGAMPEFDMFLPTMGIYKNNGQPNAWTNGVDQRERQKYYPLDGDYSEIKLFEPKY